MKYRLIVPLALACCVAVAFAQTNGDLSRSPQDVLQRFWKVENDGSRLTENGWYEATEFFSGKPIPPPVNKIIFVVSNDCSLATTSVTATKAELYLFCLHFQRLNSKLQLEKSPTSAPNGEPIVQGMLIPFKLAHSDKHWELSRGRGEPREVKGVLEWRIDGFPSNYFLNTNTALRYVIQIRNQTTDPAIKRNADETIATLERQR
ncbi:MAG TPA: hypothetical protein VGI34_04955 [Candidatus Acidoferrales bacterium]|jgi:hypothetical protein